MIKVFCDSCSNEVTHQKHFTIKVTICDKSRVFMDESTFALCDSCQLRFKSTIPSGAMWLPELKEAK